MNDIQKLEKVKTALEGNNINALIVNDKDEAREAVKAILKKGSTVGCGGSMTLKECKITELLKSGDYNFLDRDKAEDKVEIYRKSFFADYYLCSSNAVTENGELYNVDGNGNRVASIVYGPERVVMVVGKNKIVPDVESAVKRIKCTAAPENVKRLGCDTYCGKAGICLGANGGMTDGCKSPSRICSQYLVSGFQRIKGRISVILVNEELGY